jgi:transposase InsO family protein
MEVSRPNHLWVSDITYISVADGYGYLSLVTDAYSRKIIGYCLRPDLKKEGPLEALNNALDGWVDRREQLIHHSDRGLQYCCGDYTMTLKNKGISISMTENGDPYENALAERINGILKEEFLLDKDFDDFEQARIAVEQAVNTYNSLRPHASCDYQTPDQAHNLQGPLNMRWKKKKKEN